MNRLIWLICLILLFIIGLFLCHKVLCYSSLDNNNNYFLLEAKDNNFESISYDQIRFSKSNDNHLSSSVSLDNLITDVSSHLIANPNRKLTVTGYFDSLEVYSSTVHSNLGIARANDVKSWLIQKGANPNQIDLYSKYCIDNCYDADTLRMGATFNFSTL